MPELTEQQQKLVDAIAEQGGEVTGLFPLAVECEQDYHDAWRRVRMLERLGLVAVTRSEAGRRALRITLIASVLAVLMFAASGVIAAPPAAPGTPTPPIVGTWVLQGSETPLPPGVCPTDTRWPTNTPLPTATRWPVYLPLLRCDSCPTVTPGPSPTPVTPTSTPPLPTYTPSPEWLMVGYTSDCDKYVVERTVSYGDVARTSGGLLVGGVLFVALLFVIGARRVK